MCTNNIIVNVYYFGAQSIFQSFYEIVRSKTRNEQDGYSKNGKKSEYLKTAFNDYRIHYFDLVPTRVAKHLFHYCVQLL